MTAAQQKRVPQLDLLRGFAVLLVVGNHMTICPSDTNIYLNRITEFWNRGGWVGVDLFFVLSGFLISGLLFREYQKDGGLNLKRFLIRRGFKIYPAFWVFIAITCFASMFADINFYRKGLLGELFFLQNYTANLWEHTWTLAIEEHFYFGLCVLFYALLQARKSPTENPFANIPKIFAFVAVSCFAMRLLTVNAWPFEYVRNIEPTHLRIDSLFFGVFISYLWHFRNLAENSFINRHRFLLGLAGTILLLPAFILDIHSNSWIGVFGLSMFSLGSGLLLLFVLKTDFSQIPLAKSIAYIGTFSYSIYLWNVPVQRWLTQGVITFTGNDNWFFYLSVYLLGTLVVGTGMATIIEYPFLKIRNRYFPTLSPPLVRAADKVEK